MVRLKDHALPLLDYITSFQFHYGTIKSDLKLLQEKTYLLFQFHYGTIKRKQYETYSTIVPNFNSTMVRLKASG